MPPSPPPRHDARPAREEPGAPLALRALRAALRVAGAVSPRLAGRWANRLWYRTQRFPEPARERAWAQSARRADLSCGGRPLAVYDWGAGPPVLLVHGWHGRGPQLGGFAVALAAAGFRAVAFDAPAHGRTPGSSTSLPEVSAALGAVAAACGPVHGVIAHSFGVPCTLHALAGGLKVGRVVGIAAPSSIEFLVASFARALALSPAVLAEHRRLFERQFGPDLWTRFSPRELARGLKVAALLLHDADDLDVPLAEGEALAAAWPGAVLERSRGLGHRRILRDEAVIARAVRFIAEGGA